MITSQGLYKQGHDSKIGFDLNKLKSEEFAPGRLKYKDKLQKFIALVSKNEGSKDIYGRVEVSLWDILDNGFDARDFEDMWDVFSGSMSEKDQAMLTEYENAWDKNKGEIEALYDFSESEYSPEGIASHNTMPILHSVAVIGTAIGDAILHEFTDLSKREREKAGADFQASFGLNTISDKTTAVFLEHLNDVKYQQNQAAATSDGKVTPIEWSDEEAKAFVESNMDYILKTGGEMVPAVAKIIGVSILTDGVLTGAGVTSMLMNLKRSKNVYDRVKYGMAISAIEAAKFKTAMPEAGIAGGPVFALTGWAGELVPGLTGRFRFINPLVKAFGQGFVATEAAALGDMAIDHVLGNADFQRSFEATHGDEEQWFKDQIAQGCAFSIHGMPMLYKGGKGHFLSTEGKRKAIQKIYKDQNKLLIKNNATKEQIKTAEGREEAKKLLSENDLNKFESMESSNRDLQNLYNAEVYNKKLDPTSKDFAENFEKMINDPVNLLVKNINPEHEGVTVKFHGDMEKYNPLFEAKRELENEILTNKKLSQKQKDALGLRINNIDKQIGKMGESDRSSFEKIFNEKGELIDAGNIAEFDPNTNVMNIWKPGYTAGKASHEYVHMLLRAMFKTDSNLELNFTNNLRKLFDDYNFEIAQTADGKYIALKGKELEEYIRSEYGEGKVEKTKEGKIDLRYKKGRDLTNEEFLAFTAEFLSTPEAYNKAYSGSFLTEMKNSVTQIYRNATGQSPRIQSVDDLRRVFASFGKGIRGKTSKRTLQLNAKAIAELAESPFLGIQSNNIGKPSSQVGKVASKKIKNKQIELARLNVKKQELFEQIKKEKGGDPIKLKSIQEEYRSTIEKLKQVDKDTAFEVNVEDVYNKGVEGVTKVEKSKPTGLYTAEAKGIELQKARQKLAFDVANLYDPRTTKSAGAARINTMLNKYRDLPGFKLMEDNILDHILTTPGEKGAKGRSIREMVLDYRPEEGVPLSGYIGKILQQRGISESVKKFIPEGVKFTTQLDAIKEIAAETVNYEISTAEITGRGTVLKRTLNVKPESVLEIESKINTLDFDNISYKTLKDLTPEASSGMFGVVPKKGNLQRKSVENAQEFIDVNAQALIDLLPEGAISASAPEALKGTSTGVAPKLLEAFYHEASKAELIEMGFKVSEETGRIDTPVGPRPKVKNTDISTESFKEFFGINKDGTRSYDRNLSAKVKGIINETGRAVTNQVIEDLISSGKAPKGLYTKYNTNQLLHQMISGKSEKLASRDILEWVRKKLGEEEGRITTLGLSKILKEGGFVGFDLKNAKHKELADNLRDIIIEGNKFDITKKGVEELLLKSEREVELEKDGWTTKEIKDIETKEAKNWNKGIDGIIKDHPKIFSGIEKGKTTGKDSWNNDPIEVAKHAEFDQKLSGIFPKGMPEWLENLLTKSIGWGSREVFGELMRKDTQVAKSEYTANDLFWMRHTGDKRGSNGKKYNGNMMLLILLILVYLKLLYENLI